MPLKMITSMHDHQQPSNPRYIPYYRSQNTGTSAVQFMPNLLPGLLGFSFPAVQGRWEVGTVPNRCSHLVNDPYIKVSNTRKKLDLLAAWLANIYVPHKFLLLVASEGLAFSPPLITRFFDNLLGSK